MHKETLDITRRKCANISIIKVIKSIRRDRPRGDEKSKRTDNIKRAQTKHDAVVKFPEMLAAIFLEDLVNDERRSYDGSNARHFHHTNDERQFPTLPVVVWKCQCVVFKRHDVSLLFDYFLSSRYGVVRYYYKVIANTLGRKRLLIFLVYMLLLWLRVANIMTL